MKRAVIASWVLSFEAVAGPRNLSSAQACIARAADRADLSGVVSVALPDGTATHARGILAEPGSRELHADDRFNLGSAGKMFTAVAIAQLADAGRLRLEDEIGRWVKGLTPEAARVTLEQLLTHTSGLGNYFTPDNLDVIRRARSLSELKPLVEMDKPAFKPGARFAYSNSGYLLLGLAVEGASGMPYDRYLREHVFAPAGMIATGLEADGPPGHAVGMTAHAGNDPSRSTPELRRAADAGLRGGPAGGAFSTAKDLQRFLAALVAGKLVSSETFRRMTSPLVVAAPAKDGRPQLAYGLGFGVGSVERHHWFGHNGGAPGVNVEVAFFPDAGAGVVVLSNRDPPTASRVAHEVRELAWGGCGGS